MKNMGKAVALSTGLLLGGSYLPYVPISMDQVMAAGISNFSKTSFQTTANLNLRSGASTKNKVVLTIPKGKTVTSSQKMGSWYKISYTYSSKGKNYTKTGWVMGTYLKAKSTASSVSKLITVSNTKTSYSTTANLNLRSGAGTNYKVVITIPKGKTVTSTDRKGNWYKVSYTYTSKGKSYTKTGWVMGTYLKANQNKSSASTANSTVSGTGTVKIAKTNYSTTANLNLRSGAGTNYKTVITIPKGRIVTATQHKGSWYNVSYKYTSKGKSYTKTGWVSIQYLKEYYVYSNIKGTYYFTNKTAGLYSSPDNKKKVVSSLVAGNGLYSTQKVVNSLGQTWYRVSYNGKYLYTISSNLSTVSVKTFTSAKYQATKDTYLYSSVGTAYSKLIRVPVNSILSSARSIGGWYEVTYQGKKGYVSGVDLKSVPKTTAPSSSSGVQTAAKNYLVTASLNLRQSYSTTSAVLTVIPNGTPVTSSEKTADGWYKVTYDGRTGYVSGSYLKEYVKADDYRFIDLRTQSPVTAKQINNYISNYLQGKASVLYGKGQAFIDAGEKYGVNALYLAAHAILESGYGTSQISIEKNNLFGYGAYDITPYVATYSFSTIEQNINYIAQKMKSDYLNPNGIHFEGAFLGYRTNDSKGTRDTNKSIGMNYWYASDPNWSSKIAQHMQNILPYDKNYYAKAPINTAVPSAPSVPTGSDKFPSDIEAVAKTSLIPNIIQAGSKFNLLEKSNDYKLRVNVNGKEYWTNGINLSEYRDYFTVLNLGRIVNANTLNVRSSAEIKENNTIGHLNLNTYVSLVLDDSKKPVMDPEGNWYNIKLDNGTTGWVNKSYIKIELN